MKSKNEIRDKLSELKVSLQNQYPIASLAIFGSFAREEQTDNSDIDILIEFNGEIGSDFIILADQLEDILGQKVDLVSKNGIKEKYYNQIKNDLIYV